MTSMQDAGSSADAEAFIRFWGVRGSIPTPGPSTIRYGGNTSCVELRADGRIVVLDSGTGIRGLGLALDAEFKDQPISLTVLISHTHWDHIQGFPFFLPAWKKQNNIRILGCEGAQSGLKQTLAGQMESPYFPVSLREMPGNIEIKEFSIPEFEIGDIRVSAFAVNHPGVAVGYRLRTSGCDVVYMPDNECSGASLETPGLVDARLVECIRDADVLIADAQYDECEYPSHVGWGHGCVSDVVRLAAAAKVRKLILFHHDPSHDDDRMDAFVEEARAQSAALENGPEIIAAREGLRVDLTRP